MISGIRVCKYVHVCICAYVCRDVCMCMCVYVFVYECACGVFERGLGGFCL